MATYEQRLAALGKLLDARGMRDVCLTEVPRGIFVTGLGLVDESQRTAWQPVTFEVSELELDELSRQSATQVAPSKRRWPF